MARVRRRGSPTPVLPHLLQLLPTTNIGRHGEWMASAVASDAACFCTTTTTTSGRCGGPAPPAFWENGAAGEDGSAVPVFAEYNLDELRAATDGFAPDRIVSEQGEKAPNVVYRGTLFSSGRTVAIKRFGRSAWPDSRQFVEEARAVGLLRSGRLSNLIGCCCEGGQSTTPKCRVTAASPSSSRPTDAAHSSSTPSPSSGK